MTVWQVLGLDPDAGRDAIRRAYARKLRVTQPEDDPEGFKTLREAYEQALAQADWRESWANHEQDEREDEDDTGEERAAWTGVDTPPVRAERRETAPLPDPEPEIAQLLATRDAELATLRERMGALDSGLRGPWRASDAELEQRLSAILDAEAMGELGIRDDVEPWLAELIADTIPASDAILRQAIDAFGWHGGSAPRYHAQYRVLERLEEWRTIAALNQPHHAYHAGWSSLIGAPGHAFFWRIDAFRPSVQRGAAALLGHFGDVSPGLHHSFNTASVERWTAYLAQPRLTLGMLCQIPVLFAVLLSAAYALFATAPLVPAIAACAALAIAATVVTLTVLAPWRGARALQHHPSWQQRGWLAAYGAALVLAASLPGPWALLFLPVALGIAIWAYVATAARPHDTRIGGLAIIWAVFAFMTLPLLDTLIVAEATALATAAALFAYLRIWRAREAGAMLDDLLGERREWWVLAIVVGAVALGTGMTALHAIWARPSDFYPIALCLLAAALPLGVVTPGGGPPRWIARLIMVLAFVGAGIAALPPEKTAARDPAAVTVPVTDDGAAARSGDRTLAEAGSAQRALAAMEQQQPGFAGIRAGNPVLYAELRGDLETFYSKRATRAEAMAAFGRRIDTVYQQRLPEADPGMLLETQRIRLAVLRDLRKVDVAACAAEARTPYDPMLLDDALRSRATAQIYNVVANPPVPRALQGDATPVSGVALIDGAARVLGIDRDETARRIAGGRGVAAQCDARIAMLGVMIEMPRDAVVAMLRRELRRQRAR